MTSHNQAAWHIRHIPRANANTYRSGSSSCLRFRRFAYIMRHVKFSMRSRLGKLCLVFLKNFHTWVASGSFSCICSRVSSVPAMSFCRFGKRGVFSRSNGFGALPSTFEKSRFSSCRRQSPGLSCSSTTTFFLVDTGDCCNCDGDTADGWSTLTPPLSKGRRGKR